MSNTEQHEGGGTAAAGDTSGQSSKKKSSMWNRTVRGAGSVADGTIKGIKTSSVAKIVSRIRVISVVCAVFTFAIGLYGFTIISACKDCWVSSLVVVGLYTVGASLFLLVVEGFLYFSKTGKPTAKLKAGFKIIYTIRGNLQTPSQDEELIRCKYLGRGLYVMFMGTLCWSSLSNTWGEWIVNVVFGTVVFLCGIYIIVAYYKHPTLSKVKDPLFYDSNETNTADQTPDLENQQTSASSSGQSSGAAAGSTAQPGATGPSETKQSVQRGEVKQGEAVKDKEVTSANTISSWWRRRKSGS